MGSAEDRERDRGGLGRTRRKGEDGNAAGTRYVQGRMDREERGVKSYLIKVMEKRRRWMELETRIQ